MVQSTSRLDGLLREKPRIVTPTDTHESEEETASTPAYPIPKASPPSGPAPYPADTNMAAPDGESEEDEGDEDEMTVEEGERREQKEAEDPTIDSPRPIEGKVFVEATQYVESSGGDAKSPDEEETERDTKACEASGLPVDDTTTMEEYEAAVKKDIRIQIRNNQGAALLTAYKDYLPKASHLLGLSP